MAGRSRVSRKKGKKLRKTRRKLGKLRIRGGDPTFNFDTLSDNEKNFFVCLSDELDRYDPNSRMATFMNNYRKGTFSQDMISCLNKITIDGGLAYELIRKFVDALNTDYIQQKVQEWKQR